MNFAWGSGFLLLFLIPVVLLLALLLVRRLLWQKKIVRILVAAQHEKKFLQSFSLIKKYVQVICLVSGLFFLALSLGRPQWDAQEQIVEQVGRDIIIALDISRSMLAQDVKPTRLEHAKEKIKKIVSQLATDRIALLVFAGDAFLLCPFTTDMAAFLLFLDSVNHETLSVGSTALNKAIAKAIELFKALPTRKSKLLLTLTDGEDFSQNSTSDLKAEAQEIGLQIFTIGIGTDEGAPVPIVDKLGKITDYEKDESGAIVLSRLNQPLLQQIAAQTGAYSLQSRADHRDIAQLMRYLEKVEKEKFDEKKVTTQQEKYYYFAAVSLLCCLLDWIL